MIKKVVQKSAYKEPAYKELLVIRNWFLFPNLYTSLVCYTLIRNSCYKEHILLVSSLYCIIILPKEMFRSQRLLLVGKETLTSAHQNPPTLAYSTGWGRRQDTITSKWVLFTSLSHLQMYWTRNSRDRNGQWFLTKQMLLLGTHIDLHMKI